jgi:hypothetical protein
MSSVIRNLYIALFAFVVVLVFDANTNRAHGQEITVELFDPESPVAYEHDSKIICLDTLDKHMMNGNTLFDKRYQNGSLAMKKYVASAICWKTDKGLLAQEGKPWCDDVDYKVYLRIVNLEPLSIRKLNLCSPSM